MVKRHSKHLTEAHKINRHNIATCDVFSNYVHVHVSKSVNYMSLLSPIDQGIHVYVIQVYTTISEKKGLNLIYVRLDHYGQLLTV